jgi:hypothetical protein
MQQGGGRERTQATGEGREAREVDVAEDNDDDEMR